MTSAARLCADGRVTGGRGLLAPDPAVPYLEELLDSDEMRAVLAAHAPRVRVGPVRTCRVKYRVGHSLRVVYEAGTSAGPWIVTARTFRDAGGPRAARRALPNAIDCGSFPSVFEDAKVGAAFWTFPNDRALDDLPSLLAPAADLAAIAPGRWDRSRLVSYVPEKCAVVACLAAGREPAAYAKQYSPVEASLRFPLQTALASLPRQSGDLRLPRILGVSPAHQTIVAEAAAGERLTDVDAREAPAGLVALGRAVARFHGFEIPASAPPFPRMTAASVVRAAAAIAQAQPGLRASVEAVAETLVASAPPDAGTVLVHGDLHLKNAFLDGDAVALIDLDQAAAGPAAADLGSLLALLVSDTITRGRSRDGAAALADAFLDGYASVRALPSRAAIDWHVAAALVEERALRAVCRMRLPLLLHLDDVIDEAGRMAEGVRP